MSSNFEITTANATSLRTSTVSKKGDLLVASTTVPASQASIDSHYQAVNVGTDGQVLTADSTQALGVKWAATAAPTGVNLEYLTSNYTNATTTPSNVFTGITSVANSVYLIEMNLTGVNSSPGNGKLQIVAPAGSTVTGIETSDINAVASSVITAINTNLARSITSTAQGYSIWATVTTGATTGNISVGGNNVGAGTLTVNAGSYMRITNLTTNGTVG